MSREKARARLRTWSMSTQPAHTLATASTMSTAPIVVCLAAMAAPPPTSSATPTGSVMTAARIRPFMFDADIIQPPTSATCAREMPHSPLSLRRYAESAYYASRLFRYGLLSTGLLSRDDSYPASQSFHIGYGTLQPAQVRARRKHAHRRGELLRAPRITQVPGDYLVFSRVTQRLDSGAEPVRREFRYLGRLNRLRIVRVRQRAQLRRPVSHRRPDSEAD